MKRRQVNTLLDLLDHLVCNKLAAHEFLRTMHYTVAHSLDIIQSRKNSCLLIKKRINDSLDTHSVVLDRHFLNNLFLSCRLMLKTADFQTDSLYKTFGEQIINLVALHVKKLILQ